MRTQVTCRFVFEPVRVCVRMQKHLFVLGRGRGGMKMVHLVCPADHWSVIRLHGDLQRRVHPLAHSLLAGDAHTYTDERRDQTCGLARDAL